jgi:hypothetical protein
VEGCVGSASLQGAAEVFFSHVNIFFERRNVLGEAVKTLPGAALLSLAFPHHFAVSRTPKWNLSETEERTNDHLLRKGVRVLGGNLHSFEVSWCILVVFTLQEKGLLHEGNIIIIEGDFRWI